MSQLIRSRTTPITTTPSQQPAPPATYPRGTGTPRMCGNAAKNSLVYAQLLIAKCEREWFASECYSISRHCDGNWQLGQSDSGCG